VLHHIYSYQHECSSALLCLLEHPALKIENLQDWTVESSQCCCFTVYVAPRNQSFHRCLPLRWVWKQFKYLRWETTRTFRDVGRKLDQEEKLFP
jgi:hypothetical protein